MRMELSAADTPAKQAAAEIDAGTGVGAAIAELLVRRQVTSAEEAEKFFAPSLNDLHDPFLMPDMDKAVHRLNKAMGAKERIMITATTTWTEPPPWRSSTNTCRTTIPT